MSLVFEANDQIVVQEFREYHIGGLEQEFANELVIKK